MIQVQLRKRQYVFNFQRYNNIYRYYKVPDGMPDLIFKFWGDRFQNQFYWGTKWEARPWLERRKWRVERRLNNQQMFYHLKRYLPHIRYEFPDLLYQKRLPNKPKKLGPNAWRKFRRKKTFPLIDPYYKKTASIRAHHPNIVYNRSVLFFGWKVIMFDLKQKTLYSFFAVWWTFLIALLYYQDILYMFSLAFVNFQKEHTDFFWTSEDLFVYSQITDPLRVKTWILGATLFVFNLAYWTYLWFYFISLQLRRTASLLFLVYGGLYLIMVFIFFSLVNTPAIDQFFKLALDHSEPLWEVSNTETKDLVTTPWITINEWSDSCFETLRALLASRGLEIESVDDIWKFADEGVGPVIDGELMFVADYINTLELYIDEYNYHHSVHFQATNSYIVDFLRVNIQVRLEKYQNFVFKYYGLFLVLLYLPIFLYSLQILEITNMRNSTKKQLTKYIYRYTWVFLAFFEANFMDYWYFIKAAFIIVTLEVFIFFITFLNFATALISKMGGAPYY